MVNKTVIGWFFMVCFLCYPWFQFSECKDTKKNGALQIFPPKTCNLTLHFRSNFTIYIIRWRMRVENVRETWGRTNVPHMPSVLCTSALKACHVKKWGIFSSTLIFYVRHLANTSSTARVQSDVLWRSVRRLRTRSPQASNSQSVRTD